jgi:hypothetical protein
MIRPINGFVILKNIQDEVVNINGKIIMFNSFFSHYSLTLWTIIGFMGRMPVEINPWQLS